MKDSTDSTPVSSATSSTVASAPIMASTTAPIMAAAGNSCSSSSTAAQFPAFMPGTLIINNQISQPQITQSINFTELKLMQLTNELAAKNAENQHLKTQNIVQTHNDNSMLHTLSIMNINLQNQNQQLQEANKKLENDANQFRADMKELESKNKKLRANMKELESKNKKLENEHEIIKSAADLLSIASPVNHDSISTTSIPRTSSSLASHSASIFSRATPPSPIGYLPYHAQVNSPYPSPSPSLLSQGSSRSTFSAPRSRGNQGSNL